MLTQPLAIALPVISWNPSALKLMRMHNSQTRCSVGYQTDPRQQAASERCSVLSVCPCCAASKTLCRGCGKNIATGRSHCAPCSIEGATERIADAARLGRLAARNPAALTKQSDSQRRHANARSSWDNASQPPWLTPEGFSQTVQPLLANISTSAIRLRIGVSRWYASKIRQGYCPHAMHWSALAALVGITG
jgi:hypothetical protein